MKIQKAIFSLLLSACIAGAAACPGPALAAEDTASGWFSARDISGSYDEGSAVYLTAEGSPLTIESEGVYIISGGFDSPITVDADKNAKVQLVLDNADIITSEPAAIYINKADKVFITSAAGSVNTLEAGGSADTAGKIDGVIYSKADLTLNGSGTLNIIARSGSAVVSKKELTICGGFYNISSAEHGLSGKESLAVSDGSFDITAGKDGLHAKNEDDENEGRLYIAGGEFNITSASDAIAASGSILIDGGSFNLTSGGGSSAAVMKQGDSMGGMNGGFGRNPGGMRGGFGGSPNEGRGDFGGMPDEGRGDFGGMPGEGRGNFGSFNTAPAADPLPAESGSTVSAKGIKSSADITINGGSFTLDTADDGVHSGGDILITGGEWSISTGDDAVHADSSVTIRGGSFAVPYCYEGIEGMSITIDGGSFDITARDDGFNAAGGADSSGGPWMQSNGDNYIIINAGSIKVVSDGDCLDSNGSITLNGGTLDLNCGGYGNSAVDSSGSYVNNGADITTNDGSENGGGAFFGRGGMQGGFERTPGGFDPNGDSGRAPGGFPSGQPGRMDRPV